ncbi:uncharacterized protein [Haliotis cracherodii]|uniref:uncharacterized protein n=1 Tax=Haliotis cracherodii TaxID=6455 RepID=UPI0039E90C0B
MMGREVLLFLSMLSLVQGISPRLKTEDYFDPTYPRFGLLKQIATVDVDAAVGGAFKVTGIAASRLHDNVLYYIGRNINVVLAADSTTGTILAKFTLTDAVNDDWQGIAVGPCDEGSKDTCVYVQDAGKGGDTSEVYKFREPTDVTTDASFTSDLTIQYSSPKSRGSSAIIVNSHAEIFFFSPGYPPGSSQLRKLVMDGDSVKVTTKKLKQFHVPSIAVGKMAILAADISCDDSKILIQTVDHIYLFRINGTDFDSLDCPIPLPFIAGIQVRGITWIPNGEGFYVSLRESPSALMLSMMWTRVPDAKFTFGRTVGLNDYVYSSGFAASRDTPGLLYTAQEDSTIINVIQTQNAKRISTLRIRDVSTTVWNDVAVGRCNIGSSNNCVYLLDGGKGYNRFPEPADARRVDTVPADVFTFSLPDGVPATSIMVDPEANVYVIGKGLRGVLYRLDGASATKTPVALGAFSSLPLPLPITSADISADGSELLVKTITNILLYNVDNLNYGAAILGEPCVIPFVENRPRKASIAFGPEGKCFFTLSGTGYAPLRRHDRIPECQDGCVQRHQYWQ